MRRGKGMGNMSSRKQKQKKNLHSLIFILRLSHLHIIPSLFTSGLVQGAVGRGRVIEFHEAK